VEAARERSSPGLAPTPAAGREMLGDLGQVRAADPSITWSPSACSSIPDTSGTAPAWSELAYGHTCQPNSSVTLHGDDA
jgi:hypothetical protein